MNALSCEKVDGDSACKKIKMNALDNEDIDEDMPFELIEHARAASMDVLPQLSREKYNRVYQNFKVWQDTYKVKKISVDLILAYFHVLAEKKYKPSSLWAFHSMLKATLRAYENTDIGTFSQVSAFLKTKADGFKPIKAEVFSEDELKKFIDEAENITWLDVKVACIFGICGACRTDEFTRFTVDDIEKHGGMFLVKIQKTKTKVSRTFTINGGFAMIVQKYMDLRPERLKPSERFFVNLQRGKCTMQFIGKNKFSHMPRRIAEFLQLPEPQRYTGHSFRRTSATILANNGADMETIMRHGGWRNESCAKGYIEDSLAYKTRTGEMIRSSVLGGLPSVVLLSPTVATPPSSVSVLASVSNGSSASSDVDMSSLFDSSIADVQLIDIVERASQNIIHDYFDSSINDTDLVDIVERASQQNTVKREAISCRLDEQFSNNGLVSNVATAAISEVAGSSAAVAKPSSSNLSLNSLLSHSFKSANFEKLEGCTFNFYLGHGKS